MGLLSHVIRELSRPLWTAIYHTAKSTHRFLKVVEPWGIALAVLGFGLSALVLVIDLEDRQAERTFRTWEVVLSSQDNPNGGNSMKLALEYLNRQYTPPTWMCGEWIRSISIALTGNSSRNCFIPKKNQASFENAKFNKVNLSGTYPMAGKLMEGKPAECILDLEQCAIGRWIPDGGRAVKYRADENKPYGSKANKSRTFTSEADVCESARGKANRGRPAPGKPDGSRPDSGESDKGIHNAIST